MNDLLRPAIPGVCTLFRHSLASFLRRRQSRGVLLHDEPLPVTKFVDRAVSSDDSLTGSFASAGQPVGVRADIGRYVTADHDRSHVDQALWMPPEILFKVGSLSKLLALSREECQIFSRGDLNTVAGLLPHRRGNHFGCPPD